jgi:hypothetical protein
VTHKAEVIRRWLRHESPAQIARVLDHSQEAVDRYITDFQKVRLLAQKFATVELPGLTGLSASVVKQYLELLEQYEPTLALYEASPGSSPQAVEGPVSAPGERDLLLSYFGQSSGVDRGPMR